VVTGVTVAGFVFLQLCLEPGAFLKLLLTVNNLR